MVGLYLLAAHLVGDLLLQNRWMARRKLDSWRWRTYHVTWYCVPFLPIVALYWPGWPRAVGFVAALFAAHWLTDSREFRSTFGDFVHWHLFAKPAQRKQEWVRTVSNTRGKTMDSLPPNAWPLVSSAVDQTLHLAELAIIAGLLLG